MLPIRTNTPLEGEGKKTQRYMIYKGGSRGDLDSMPAANPAGQPNQNPKWKKTCGARWRLKITNDCQKWREKCSIFACWVIWITPPQLGYGKVLGLSAPASNTRCWLTNDPKIKNTSRGTSNNQQKHFFACFLLWKKSDVFQIVPHFKGFFSCCRPVSISF